MYYTVKGDEFVIKTKIEKDMFWQMVRGLCIVSVVICHSINALAFDHSSFEYNYWLILRSVMNFPVALFFFLSGYFVKAEETLDYKSYLKTKLWRLLSPYIFWALVYTLIDVAYFGFSPVEFVRDILSGGSAPQMYFMLVIIQLALLTPLLIKGLKNKTVRIILYFVTPINMILMYVYAIAGGPQMPRVGWLFTAHLLFYIIGLDRNKIKFTSLRTAIILAVSALGLRIVESYILVSYLPNAEIFRFSIASILYPLTLINLLFAMKPKFMISSNNILSKLGNVSYGVFYIHFIWILLLDRSGFNTAFLPLTQLVQVCLSLCLSIISIIIIRRLFGKESSKLIAF